MVNISLRVLSRPDALSIPVIARELGTDYDEKGLCRQHIDDYVDQSRLFERCHLDSRHTRDFNAQYCNIMKKRYYDKKKFLS
jgi:hypothetical protein